MLSEIIFRYGDMCNLTDNDLFNECLHKSIVTTLGDALDQNKVLSIWEDRKMVLYSVILQDVLIICLVIVENL